ncbi:hypothetical protein Scep_029520 [Stephania cephalantha]|uniref:Uncharacterized protein n=1 Tax=Stephania cephalantha TaxID=152367 RepID=A0AAP0E5H2_9MAGN
MYMQARSPRSWHLHIHLLCSPPYMKFSTSARGTSPPRNAGTYHIYGHRFQ